MIKYTVIATDDEHYKLSAIFEDGKYVMASLECFLNGELQWCWDNEDYLINKLFPMLTGKIGFEEIKNDIPVKDFPDLLELFNEAIKMKFFN